MFNALLVLGGIALGFYAYQEALRYAPRDVIFTAPFRGEGFFNIEILREENVSLESRGRQMISRGGRQAVSHVIYTDAEYFRLQSMNFIEGAPWFEEEENSIVLNEALAWYLFGGNNIAGLSVGIGDGIYRIGGVVRQRETEYMAWLPLNDRNSSVSAFFFNIYPHNALDARWEVYRLLENRVIADYAVVDVNSYVENMGIRHRFLLYAVWLFILIALVRRFWEYKSNHKKSLPLLLPAGFALFVLTGIHDIILWLPNPADPHASFFVSISNMGLLPPDVYLSYGMRLLSRLNRLGNIALAAGGLGFVNLIFAYLCQDF